MSLFNFDLRTSRLVLAGAALAAAGVVFAPGCGGTDTSTIDGFCQALAAADCSYAVVQACYGSSDASIEQDTGNCISARSRIDKCNPSGLPYHPEFADGCISAHSQVYAASNIAAMSYQAVQQACLAAFNRGGTAGSACTEDSDCDVGHGLLCLVRTGGKGSCEVPTPVMGGASCKDPTAQCPSDQYCDSNFHCVAVGTKGDACGPGQPCGAGFRCHEADQLCIDQLPNGSNCTEDSDCAGGFCIKTSASNAQCAASYIFGFGSATCLDFKQ